MITYSGRKISIMGIVNLTPDSFSAPSRTASTGTALHDEEKYLPDLKDALYRIGKLLYDGADIIDIGACSTRPGSEPVSSDIEWKRLSAVLSAFRREFGDIPLSIDTFRSDIARRAMETAGKIIINDAVGCELDEMLVLAAENGLRYVATHNPKAVRCSPAAQKEETVMADVLHYFEGFAAKAAKAGLSEWILDPGLGFGKSADQNWELLSHCSEFMIFGRPVLVGYSRKRMIYEPIGLTLEDVNAGLSGQHLRLFEEQSRRAFLLALEQGVSIIRLHEIPSELK
ncbi:MAG: dihydropteroate synthase [Alistipes sp.]|nr:dihydropteroate synthase [Candidatus Minthomonas equi]